MIGYWKLPLTVTIGRPSMDHSLAVCVSWIAFAFDGGGLDVVGGCHPRRLVAVHQHPCSSAYAAAGFSPPRQRRARSAATHRVPLQMCPRLAHVAAGQADTDPIMEFHPQYGPLAMLCQALVVRVIPC